MWVNVAEITIKELETQGISPPSLSDALYRVFGADSYRLQQRAYPSGRDSYVVVEVKRDHPILKRNDGAVMAIDVPSRRIGTYRIALRFPFSYDFDDPSSMVRKEKPAPSVKNKKVLLCS